MKKVIITLSLILAGTYFMNKNVDKNVNKIRNEAKTEKITNEIKEIEKKIILGNANKRVETIKKGHLLVNAKEVKELGNRFDKSLEKFDKLTSEINKFGISGNAPEQLKEEYKISKSNIIKLHNLYIRKVSVQISTLTKEGKAL
jgi:hypothetical protein